MINPEINREEIEKYFSGENDICKYLKPVVGQRFFLKVGPDNFIGLYDKNFADIGDVMNNTDLEKMLNMDIVKNAHGDVLIAGFGIGLILLPIMNKPEVTSIDVVELQQEVIDLIAPQLPLNKKVNIIMGNIFNFTPSRIYDTMYFDTLYPGMLFPEEMEARSAGGRYIEDKELLDLFRAFVKPDGYSSFWTDH